MTGSGEWPQFGQISERMSMYSPQFQHRNSLSRSDFVTCPEWGEASAFPGACQLFQKASILGQKCSNIGYPPALARGNIYSRIERREIAQLPGHFFQFILEAWMCDPDQGLRSFTDGLTVQVGCSKLRDDVMH